MKKIFKLALKYYLKYLTKLALIIHRPTIIAIAGSANKTFVKDEINLILRELGKNVKSNPKSFNTEIGLPLAILDLPSGYNFYRDWLPAILKAILAPFKLNFPQILVLELGVSEPGDMKHLLSIINPKITIITDITQRYRESFNDMDELVAEYQYLVKKMNKNGLVILNYDNERIRNMGKLAKAKVGFFSIKQNNKDQGEKIGFEAIEIKQEGDGQLIKVNNNGSISEHKIKRFGEHHIYSLLIGLIINNYVKGKKI